jgi:hydroxypyruvate isomerase
MPRFAANLSMMFGEEAFLDRFRAAAQAGFKAIEYLFPYEHRPEILAENVRKHGLIQVLFNTPPGDWAKGERGLAALPHRRDEFRQGVQIAIHYAKMLGVPSLHMMAGVAPAHDAIARATYREALDFAADKAGEAGIKILIEPINGRDMPGYFLNDFNRATEIIGELGHPNVRLQFDIYHRQIMHGDVLTALCTLMPLIGHIQVAAAPGRHEPGTGELDDRRVLAALDELGYTGYVGCEYRPAADTLSGLEWLPSMGFEAKSRYQSGAMSVMRS